MLDWITGQKDAFESALNGEPLEVSLGWLVRTAVKHLGRDARTAFYLADPRGMELHHVVGMPASYAECVDGFKIGSDSLACGLAVYNGKPVITSDVKAEPRWKPWLWLAEKYDFRGCWSFPVRTSAGRVVGTFAIYLREPREPQPGERAFAAALQQAAAIIIDRQEAAQARDRAREEAEAASIALREADRRKDQFLATLAHELRNPLTAILNSLHLLRVAERDSGAAGRARDIVDRQVNQMVRLVDDLMEVSRITSGKIELRQERMDVAGIIRGAVEISKPLIEAAQHQLAISVPPEPMIVDADPVRITQILANILNNAAKYTKDGGQIWLTAFRDETTAAVSVRDNGAGIPADMLSKIFDLFTQAEHTSHRAQGGLGIGLTVARDLAAMHGGTVEVKSNGVNHGSEFIMRLPLADGVD